MFLNGHVEVSQESILSAMILVFLFLLWPSITSWFLFGFLGYFWIYFLFSLDGGGFFLKYCFHIVLVKDSRQIVLLGLVEWRFLISPLK